jgi:putative nucleotidyltransferase with HDIG domain
MRLTVRSALLFYVSTLAVLAGAAFVLADFTIPGDLHQFRDTFAALVGLGIIAEFFSLQLRVGPTSAVSFVPYLAAIWLVGPAWAMLLAGASELFAETLIRRKPLIKIVHNTAKETLAVGVAGALFVAAGGKPSLVEFEPTIPAFLAATVVYFLISNGAVATAVGLSSRTNLGDAWGEIVGKGLAQDVVSSSLAPLLAFVWLQLELLGLLLVTVPLFFVRHALSSNLKLEQTNRELLELMVKSIEARDPYTSGHSVRVAMYAKAIARGLGLSAREIEQIETAALLHDVGKIYEEFAPILRKESTLSMAERDLIRTHPSRSAELVRTITSLRGYVERCVRSHHENFDGGGYPAGIAGDEIPLGARIIMVADTADAMMTDRPYRSALSYDEVLLEFEEHKGTQFDPTVIEAFKKSTALRRIIGERRDDRPESTHPPERQVHLAIY